MSLRQSYLKLLTEIMSAGALGITLLLGSAVSGKTAQERPDLQPSASGPTVGERLAAIRLAVSDVERTPARLREGERQLAWGNWWRNGGWRNGGWRNGGWRNGGWGNWHNGWHNGWPNWWHNW
jgi:rSAM-associated Gly-rich repeat protein